MSAVATTKPGAGRPPNFPPTRTTFSGGSDDDRPDGVERTLHHIEVTLKAVRNGLPELSLHGLKLVLAHLHDLRNLIDYEDAMLSQGSDSLPPILGFSIDYLAEQRFGIRARLQDRRDQVQQLEEEVKTIITLRTLLGEPDTHE